MASLESLPAAFIVDGRGRIAYIGDALTLEAPLRRIVAGDWDLAAARRRWDESRRAEFLRGDVAGAIESEEAAVALSEGAMQEAEKRTLAEFRAAALHGPR